MWPQHTYDPFPLTGVTITSASGTQTVNYPISPGFAVKKTELFELVDRERELAIRAMNRDQLRALLRGNAPKHEKTLAKRLL